MPEEAISHQPLAVSQRVREYDHAKHEPVRRVLRWAITHIGFRSSPKNENRYG